LFSVERGWHLVIQKGKLKKGLDSINKKKKGGDQPAHPVGGETWGRCGQKFFPVRAVSVTGSEEGIMNGKRW